MSQSVTIVTLFIKEVTPKSNNSEIMVHLFNGILYSNENKWAITTYISHQQNAKLSKKKPDIKEYKLISQRSDKTNYGVKSQESGSWWGWKRNGGKGSLGALQGR